MIPCWFVKFYSCSMNWIWNSYLCLELISYLLYVRNTSLYYILFSANGLTSYAELVAKRVFCEIFIHVSPFFFFSLLSMVGLVRIFVLWINMLGIRGSMEVILNLNFGCLDNNIIVFSWFLIYRLAWCCILIVPIWVLGLWITLYEINNYLETLRVVLFYWIRCLGLFYYLWWKVPSFLAWSFFHKFMCVIYTHKSTYKGHYSAAYNIIGLCIYYFFPL